MNTAKALNSLFLLTTNAGFYVKYISTNFEFYDWENIEVVPFYFNSVGTDNLSPLY